MNPFLSIIVVILIKLSSFDISFSSSDDLLSSDTLLFPKAKHREQSKLIYQLLSKYHFKKVDVDDSLSEKILENILKA